MIQYLSYLPSKGSGYGQAIVPRSLPLAVEACEKFASKYCPHYLEKSVEFSIEYVTGSEENHIPFSVVESAIKEFGPPPKDGDFTWRGVDYQSAKSILLSGHPWPPAYGIGPVTLTYGGIVDFSNTEDTKFDKSMILFMLQKSSKIVTQIVFPVEMEASRFKEVTLKLLRDLPISPSMQNFRVMQSKTSGDGFKFRKLSDPEKYMVSGLVENAA